MRHQLWFAGCKKDARVLRHCNENVHPLWLLCLHGWAVLSDEQMSNGYPFSLGNDEQMSNKVGVKHQPDGLPYFHRF